MFCYCSYDSLDIHWVRSAGDSEPDDGSWAQQKTTFLLAIPCILDRFAIPQAGARIMETQHNQQQHGTSSQEGGQDHARGDYPTGFGRGWIPAGRDIGIPGEFP
jgi:hypothetical protein